MSAAANQPPPILVMSAVATPASRMGPSSRLLQRRSLMLKEQGSPHSSPKAYAYAPSPRRYLHDGGDSVNVDMMDVSVTRPMAAASLSRYLGSASSPAVEVTRPLYSYHSATTGKSDVDALVLATENLFVDFMSSCNVGQQASLADAIDQVAEFEELLEDHINTIHSALEKSINITQTNYTSTLKVKENLRHERNTWRLVAKLFSIRPDVTQQEMKENEVLTEQVVVEGLFDRNADLRRAQAIVDWLELNAKDDVVQNDNVYGDSLLGWENTLHAMTQQTTASKKERMVTQLDPDSKRRQQKQLHEVDEQDEQRLVKIIFLYVRAGMLERAKELCVEMGQPWRAATLVGWKLGHDPNLGTANEDKVPVTGNLKRDIWKKSAWTLSRDSNLPAQERAIYSALCGNAKQLVAHVCSSWEDMVWALVKSMVDVLVEKELRATLPKAYVALPDEYWDNKVELGAILQAVKNTALGNVQEEMSSPYRIIQSHVILKEWEKLSAAVTEWSDTDDPHLLRFMCHLMMTLSNLLGSDVKNEARQQLLESYIEYLIRSNRVHQVAWYTSQLEEDAQVFMYSHFLETVSHDDDRQLCLNLGFEHCLPMRRIRFTLVDNILSSTSSEETEDDVDGAKIRALDWLLFEPLEREYAVVKSNSLLRFLVAEHKMEKAKMVVNKVKEILPTSGEEECGDDAEDHVKEHLCLDLFVGAKEAFSDWFEFYHKGQPKKPAQPATGKKEYTAKVEYEHKIIKYKDELERWQESLLIQSREVSARLREILTYPGGWLSCRTLLLDDDNASSSRVKELTYLRSTCVVEAVFLLHTVLHSTMQYQEATRIADLLGGESNGLYSLFSKEDMKKLLLKLKESSVALIESCQKDPWGYPKK